MVEAKVKARPRASAKDDFLFSSFNTASLELASLCRIAVPLIREISLVIYPSVLFILAVHLSIAQVTT